MTSIRDSPGERNTVQAISLLKRGSYLLKYGRWGKPKFCPFQLSTNPPISTFPCSRSPDRKRGRVLLSDFLSYSAASQCSPRGESILPWCFSSSDETTLIWYAGKEEKQLRLSQVSRIIPGQRTENFQRYPQPEKEHQSFSLIYGKNSLDVICKDRYEAEIWLVALQTLLSRGECKKTITENYTEGSFIKSGNSADSKLYFSSIPSKSSDCSAHEEKQNPPISTFPCSRSPDRKRGRVLLSDFLSYSAASQCSPRGESFLCSHPDSNLDDTRSRNSADTTRASFSSVLSASSLESSLEDIQLSKIFIWGEGVEDGALGGGIPRVGRTFGNKDTLLPKVLESASVLEAQYISCGSRHAVLISREGQIYSWGDGAGGKLGHGTEADIFNPKLIDTVSQLCIVSTGCGEYHTCAVTATGDLYTWGDGILNVGLLGHGNEVSYWTPCKVRRQMDDVHVTAVSCGPWHSAALTSTGQLFTFGDGTFGALGHGDRCYIRVPREVETLKGLKTVKVSCGFWHTAAIVEVPSETPICCLSPTRKLFTWGNGDEGQLGHGDKVCRLIPCHVSMPNEQNFCQVACGHSITVALTISGKVYFMGNSNSGEFGFPGNTHALPVCIEGNIKNCFVEEISCGSHHVVALTSKSEVFTWGRGRNGQLGHGDNADRHYPTLVEALKGKQVKRVFCGNNFTAAICRHQHVCAADYSICAGCRTAFSFRLKRHNCYNCGLVFCKACTNKKSLNASLAPNMNKMYRVCEDCFVKLNKGVDIRVRSRPPRSKGECGHGNPTVKPKESKPKEHGLLSRLSSFDSFRKSNTPHSKKNYKLYPSSNNDSPLHAKDFECDTSCLSSPSTSIFDCSEKINPSLPFSRMHSLASSPISTGSSPAHVLSFQSSFGGVPVPEEAVDDPEQTNDNLSEEISILRVQVEVLEHKSQFLASELEIASSRLKEATALFQDEHEKHNAAKEAIKCLMKQLKEMAARVPQGVSCRASGPFVDNMFQALGTAST